MTADLTSQHPKLVVRSAPKAPMPAPEMAGDMSAATEMDMEMAKDMAKDMSETKEMAPSEAPAEAMDKMPAMPTEPPVGFIVVVEGPGTGAYAPLFDGVNDIGSSADRTVTLDFGDDAISPESHAIVVYDARERMFQLNHTGQRVLVRHNGASVLGPVMLENGDTIEISKTTLRFVQLCGKDFAWPEEN